MFTRAYSIPLALVFLCSVAATARGDGHFISKEVEYKTEDGWTISATLRLPTGADRNNEYAAMLLLHEKEHERLDVGDNDQELAHRLPIEARIATLAIDWRGREKSMGEHQPIPDERHDFSTRMQEQMYLDVKGALEFLAAYPGVDRLRIGVLASQFSAEPAVRGIRETASIPTRALVLLGGENLSDDSKDYLASVDTPLYVGASILDKPVFLDMAEVYANARNPASHMFAPQSAGRGFNLVRRGTQPQVELQHLIDWLSAQVKGLGRIRAVSYRTKDDWEIHGNLRYPDDLGNNGKRVPGVIQVSGARSNRYSMYRFEEEFARRGFAVLSIELRGRGQSMQGRLFDSEEVFEVRENLLASPFELDTEGAIDFLASLGGIDPDRIAIVGEARGTRSALLAAEGDARVKAMILISAYEADERMEQATASLDIPMLLIDTETNWAREGTELVHERAKNSQLMIYPRLGHSHHIRYFHPQMVGLMGDFLARELPAAD
ncbi:MAG: dienelactone hydrolase family protein [Gammaproteobacteria bacterium]|nr:dienelactone hydrolase family protein [Gammaproteobacteria bacterium]